MKDLTSYIKENDRDKKELDSFKRFATTLTGIEEVEGETIADVIGFINDNYVGGSSGGSSEPTMLYSAGDDYYYLFKDKECTIPVLADELHDIFLKGCIVEWMGMYYTPSVCKKTQLVAFNLMMGEAGFLNFNIQP